MIKQHVGQIRRITIGGVELAARDAKGNILFTCCTKTKKNPNCK